jgi:tetratricopeptide (TPR) repeat protein
LDAAIDAFRAQVAAKPFHDRAHSHLAGALSLAGRRDEAIAAYAKHVEIAPLDGAAFNQLGRLLLEADRYAEAIPRLERAAALTPNDAWTHARLGAAHAGTRDAAKARAAFEAAIRLSATPPIWTYAGWHLAEHVLEPAWASELTRKTLTYAAERLNGLALSAAGSRERDLVERLGWSWATVGLLDLRDGRVEQAERYLTAAQVVLGDRYVARRLAAVRAHLKRTGPPITWDAFWRAAGGGTRPAGRARLTVLVGADGKVTDARFDRGAEDWRAVAARLAGAPLPLALPDATITRLPIELDVECPADPGGCRATVALKAWQ